MSNEDEIDRVRRENTELRRVLEKHQWGGLTPVQSVGACPECAGTPPPTGQGHRPGCAVAAALRSAPA